MAVHDTLRRLQRRILAYNIRGIFPFHYILIWFIIMTMLARYIGVFNAYYAKRPILTTMLVNGILGGIADTVAQSLTAVRANSAHRRWHAANTPTFEPPSGTTPLSSPRVEPLAAYTDIELTEKDAKTLARRRAAILPGAPDPASPFDLARLARFVAYGVVMAPVQFLWFKGLSKAFPMTEKSAMGPAMKRVVADQVLFAPVGVAVFFTAMTAAEGGGVAAIKRKLKDMWWPTVKANWLVWPAVQAVNFRLMPVQFQLPFVSTIGIAWTAYLSLTNAAEDIKPGDIALA